MKAKYAPCTAGTGLSAGWQAKSRTLVEIRERPEFLPYHCPTRAFVRFGMWGVRGRPSASLLVENTDDDRAINLTMLKCRTSFILDQRLASNVGSYY